MVQASHAGGRATSKSTCCGDAAASASQRLFNAAMKSGRRPARPRIVTRSALEKSRFGRHSAGWKSTFNSESNIA
jgi:hypothetical protein